MKKWAGIHLHEDAFVEIDVVVRGKRTREIIVEELKKKFKKHKAIGIHTPGHWSNAALLFDGYLFDVCAPPPSPPPRSRLPAHRHHHHRRHRWHLVLCLHRWTPCKKFPS